MCSLVLCVRACTCAIAKGESEGCAAAAAVLGDSGGRMEAGAMAKGESGPGAAAEAGVADLRCTRALRLKERRVQQTHVAYLHTNILSSAQTSTVVSSACSESSDTKCWRDTSLGSSRLQIHARHSRRGIFVSSPAGAVRACWAAAPARLACPPAHRPPVGRSPGLCAARRAARWSSRRPCASAWPQSQTVWPSLWHAL